MQKVQSYTPDQPTETPDSPAENTPEVQEVSEAPKETKTKDEKLVLKKKKGLPFLISGIIFLLGGIGAIVAFFLIPDTVLADLIFPTIPSAKDESKPKVYSSITGLELASESEKNAPVYCIQTPNGLDGARPQAGLTDAGVVFEAIAERGITRFAAIYQNPKNAIIGPIRSLRLYYLQWDTPFDCTIVHAGGAADAISALYAGGYKNMNEDYNYTFRGEYDYHLWNNLFTTPSSLSQNSADKGRGTSNPTGFTRMTPEESAKLRVDKTYPEGFNPTDSSLDDTTGNIVSSINITFGQNSYFNVHYSYNAATNSYDRSYAYGEPHNSYLCTDPNIGEVDPQDYCKETQISPAVVIAMLVNEHVASDGYHEDITTAGTGTAYIFQNGIAIEGLWHKASPSSQIVFKDGAGQEIKLAPGQTWISAVPTYGSVSY